MSGIGLCINPEKSFLGDENRRTFYFASLCLIINSIYAASNIIIGFYEASDWFVSAGIYYIILAVMRFGIIISEKRRYNEEYVSNTAFIRVFTGILLIIMSIVLSVSVYLSVINDTTEKNHEIVVITMAVYAFAKITLSIINFIKRKCLDSPVLALIRNISLADAAVSVFSLQKSMLVSFQGMNDTEIMIMNVCTGTAVCLLVMLIGIGIIYSEIKEKRNKNGNVKNS